jgi:uncharacterized protein (TIGR00255 family)
MSIRSMTGHGRGQAAGGGLRVEVEISTVNRRQLDIQLTLPPPLRLLESRIQDEIAKSVARGRVLVEVVVQGSERVKREAIRVNQDLAKAYVEALRGAAKKLNLRDDLGVSELARLPGVLHYEPLDEDVRKAWPLVEQAVARALEALQRMRAREGAALRRDLSKRLDILAAGVVVIRREAPQVAERYRKNLRERLAKAGLVEGGSDDKLQRELVLFADRSDITEELTRLDSHLAQARKLISQVEPSGRSLDFLAQEFFREINTIGSKANDAVIAAQVVTFKAELERLREQVQNVE